MYWINYLLLWAIVTGLVSGLYFAMHPKEKPKGGGGVVQTMQAGTPITEKDLEGERVRLIVGRAYWALSKRGVPWLWRLSSVARCGGSVEVARFAIEETINELRGRYWTKPLEDALHEL